MTSRTDTPVLTAADERFLSELARQLRADSIRCSTAAGSGHPTPTLPWVDVATGSLGQGLPYGVASRWPGAPWTRPPTTSSATSPRSST